MKKPIFRIFNSTITLLICSFTVDGQVLCDNNDIEIRRNGVIQVSSQSTFPFDTLWQLNDVDTDINDSVIILNVSMITSFQKNQLVATTCTAALDYILLPNGDQRCYRETFCAVFVGNLSTPFPTSFVENINQKCNATWLQSDEWPPTICAKGRVQDAFELDISYMFHGIETTEKETGKTPIQNGGSVSSLTVIVILLLVCALLLFIGAVFVYYKRKRQNERKVSSGEITPYAVHISTRRNRQQSLLPADAITHREALDQQQENGAYLIPLNYSPPGDSREQIIAEERPYCEIPLTKENPRMYNRSNAIYQLAYNVTDSHNDRNEPDISLDYDRTYKPRAKTSHQTTALVRNSNQGNLRRDSETWHISEEDIQNNYAEMAAPPATPEHNTDNTEGGSFLQQTSSLGSITAHTPYGEIIGTVEEGKSIERFKECDVKYKSVRKKWGSQSDIQHV